MPVTKGPLNYTTTIDATKSASECIARLAQHGASAIGITYNTAPGTLELPDFVAHIRSIPATDLAYTAGLLDGEGCITAVAPGVRPNGRSVAPRVRIMVYMTTPEVLVWLRDVYGGTFRERKSRQPRQKPVHVWCIEGKRAGVLLDFLLPYIKVKGAQAKVAIEFYKLQLPYTTGMKPPPQHHERLRELKTEMLRLNKRGVAA
jgi:hypothetical protein